MLRLIIKLLIFLIILAAWIIIVGGIASYLVYLMRVLSRDHYWARYYELMMMISIVLQFETSYIRLEDPTGYMADAYLVYYDRIYGPPGKVRMALNTLIIWIDGCYVLITPRSWIRYNIWLNKKIKDYRRQLQL